ncbi:MAG: hypothetical protein IIA45_11650 [Bacteroidetes bacterium]|nr:hypothetical protein [Bacteroidota bacterium]
MVKVKEKHNDVRIKFKNALRLTCRNCRDDFYARHPAAVYCSSACKQKTYRERIKNCNALRFKETEDDKDSLRKRFDNIPVSIQDTINESITNGYIYYDKKLIIGDTMEELRKKAGQPIICFSHRCRKSVFWSNMYDLSGIGFICPVCKKEWN